jgi:hypothetical protein
MCFSAPTEPRSVMHYARKQSVQVFAFMNKIIDREDSQ